MSMTPTGKSPTSSHSLQYEANPLSMKWLPELHNWNERLAGIGKDSGIMSWRQLVNLANCRIDFAQTLKLDRAVRARFAKSPPEGLETRPIRLAILGSSTVEHLFPGLRIGALRHGLWIELHAADYGQYLQAILDPTSSVHQFRPDAVLFALDAQHLIGRLSVPSDRAEVESPVEASALRLRDLWSKARAAFGCNILQQTLLPTALPLLGNNEHQLPTAPQRLIRSLNERLRALAGEEGVDIVAIDERVSANGLNAWHSPVLWHGAKQEINPLAVPMYGELVARILAARQGRSAKCLVLDLDNTLWAGVIGDDGLAGIKLGQGSALGEAHLAIQSYALALSRRGVILAVCSKNDEAVALLPFENHAEMLLRRTNIACFVANWNDKATNIRLIADQLKIGLDAMVFLDDNPFERDLVRNEIPMVLVPELPDEPALYPQCLADAGYFEAISITQNDVERARQYQENVARETLRSSSTDIEGYLRGLEMQLLWSPFDHVGLQRISQLINKTNQFNLTTRRYTETELNALMEEATTLTLQFRLVDRFGDNGIISTVIGKRSADCDMGEMKLDTWLMSCRVLGREVEKAVLNVVVSEALRLGATCLRGMYLPSARNSMVKDHYPNLGFERIATSETSMGQWRLPLDTFSTLDTAIHIQKAEQ